MTELQTLLDIEAYSSNISFKTNGETKEYAIKIHQLVCSLIEDKRKPNPPVCYGQDDCSTNILSKCPWRMTCGI